MHARSNGIADITMPQAHSTPVQPYFIYMLFMVFLVSRLYSRLPTAKPV